MSSELRRTASCGELDADEVGKQATLMGWVAGVRDLGALIFLDLRDHSGITQVVFRRGTEACEVAKKLGAEWVVAVRGTVRRRAEGMARSDMPTGEIELEAERVEVLNEAETPPFEVLDEVRAGEELRMSYRYLDLRRPRMQRNLRLRHAVTRAIRQSLDAAGFVEVETPMLIRATPEGSRDYVVPSRVHPGKFYALPQSPQLLKQLLMVSGMDRYYQMARCFRDEDLRANRQPEFTQIDLEMSFVQPDDVFAVVEDFLEAAFGAAGRQLSRPFPRMSYPDALLRYGSDKPDLRFGLEIHDASELASSSGFGVFAKAVETGGCVRGLAVPGIAASATRRRLAELEQAARKGGAQGLLSIVWNEDGQLRSPLVKHVGEDKTRALASAVGGGPGGLALFAAGSESVVRQALGELRLHCAEQEGLVDRSRHRPLWVTGFPLLEWNSDSERYEASNHPFTAPDPDDLDRLESEPEKVRALSYDCVIDGEELGSGSIRNNRLDLQRRCFRAIGLSDEQAEERFGFFLRALRYGAPPHGGIALGLERLLQVALGEPSIREILAFPKTTAAQCLLTESPAHLEPEQLAELKLRVLQREED